MRRARIVGCALLVVTSAGAAHAPRRSLPPDCYDDGRAIQALAPRDIEAVARGAAIVNTTELQGRRWPRVCVYRYIGASPEQSLAVLTDYALRPSYIPDVRASNVVPTTADSATKRVAYVIHVIFRMDETDTLREVSRRLDNPVGGYRLEWSSLSSSMAKSIAGSATFIPWRSDSSAAAGTLLIYQQAVEPGSRLAGLPFIKSRGIAAVRNAAVAIAKQVEAERARRPQQLDDQVARLRRTLPPPN